jgi:Rieske 2Fe-2S family protein
VCEEPTGNRKTFVCPYHGWVYNTDGTLKAARHMEAKEGFDCSDFNLKKVKVNVYKGMIFINCDLSAEEFLPSLQKLDVPFGGYRMENAKVAHKKTYKVDANWKLVLENYLECYHCATSHRQYAKIHTLKDLACNTDVLNEAMRARSAEQTGLEGVPDEVWEIYSDAPHFGGCVYTSRYALYDGFLTGSKDGQAVAPLMGDFKGYDGGTGDFQMGPLSFMLNYPDHCVMYRFIPRGLTETDMEIVWFVNGDAQENVDYDVESLSWLWHNTTLEDEFIIRRNNEGVNSRFFEPGPYHPEFEAVSMQFVEWYLKALAR